MGTGIPTKYHHQQFRSRLEAKWAVFFDLCGWKWEYEPFDLNGWIPDFLLIGKEENVMVEVKPFTKFKEFDTEKIIRALSISKFRGKEILLLGCSIEEEQSSFGWLGEYDVQLDEYCFGRAIIGEFGNGFISPLGFSHEYQSYRDRVSGDYTGNQPCILPEVLLEIWRTAGNQTQWHPKEATT